MSKATWCTEDGEVCQWHRRSGVAASSSPCSMTCWVLPCQNSSAPDWFLHTSLSACCWPLFWVEHQALQMLGLSQCGCFTVLMVTNPGPFDGCPRLSDRRSHLLVPMSKMRGCAAQMLFPQSRAVAHPASAEALELQVQI